MFQRGGSIIATKQRIRRCSALMHKDPYTLTMALNPSVSLGIWLHNIELKTERENLRTCVRTYGQTDGRTDGWINPFQQCMRVCFQFYLAVIREFRKSRLRRKRECSETKDLIRKTIAEHVCFKSLYNCLPFHTELKREIAKFYVLLAWKPRQQFSHVLNVLNSTLHSLVMPK